jgi:hypothetical protein
MVAVIGRKLSAWWPVQARGMSSRCTVGHVLFQPLRKRHGNVGNVHFCEYNHVPQYQPRLVQPAL